MKQSSESPEEAQVESIRADTRAAPRENIDALISSSKKGFSRS